MQYVHTRDQKERKRCRWDATEPERDLSTYTHTHMYAHTHTYRHVRTHIHIHTQMYTHRFYKKE